MNLTKKLSTLLLTLALVVGTSVTAFATPNDDAITALRNAKVPETYIIQAENYLKTTTLTADQSTAVVAQINEAAEVVKASGVTDITKLTQADKDLIIADIVAAGNAIDLTVSVSKQANGQHSYLCWSINGSTSSRFCICFKKN